MGISIGIDIGGTKIAFGLVDETGRVLERGSFPTPLGGKEEVLSLLKKEIFLLINHSLSYGIGNVEGIGIGTAGQIDFTEGRVLSGTTNIRDWNDVPLKKEIETEFNLPVWVDNDVNVVLLAEKMLGAGRGETDVVCLALGTGVGGAAISCGELIRGSWGAAAELGHISLDMNGPACNCGFRGCLEVYASGTGIARMMEELLRKDGIETDETMTSEKVFLLYHQGDGRAHEVIDKMLEALSFGIVNVIHTFNPKAVVLGGGIMKNGGWIIVEVKKRLSSIGLRSMIDPVRIAQAELGPEAGLIGAAIQTFVYKEKINELQTEGI